MKLVGLKAVENDVETDVLVNAEFVETVENRPSGGSRITMASGKVIETNDNLRKVWQDLARQ